MNDVFAAALEIQAFCQARNWKFCFIGGVAVQRWGIPRVTKDADLTLLTGFAVEDQFVDPLLKHFRPRRPDARELALSARVLLLWSSHDIGLDIALGGLEFEINCVNRASAFTLPEGQTLITCSAEDLIVHKAFAGRDRDWDDVDRILMRQGRKLDVDYIWSQLNPLLELKEAPDHAVRLQRFMDRRLR